MKKIYKYKLSIRQNISIDIPSHHKLLCAQIQNGEIVVWAIVEVENPILVKRDFQIIGTGQEAPEYSVYLSTVQLDGFVWHIFYN